MKQNSKYNTENTTDRSFLAAAAKLRAPGRTDDSIPAGREAGGSAICRKTGRFSLLCVLLLAVSLLASAGNCLPAYADGAAAAADGDPAEETTGTVWPVESYLSYSGILNLYTQAIKEEWDPAECAERGVNYLTAMVRGYGDVGYWYYDVNEDGSPELFIGCVGSREIYALYTLSADGQPLQLIDAGERSSYYLEPDNCFVNFGSGSAYSGGYRILMMGDGELYLHCALLYDFSVNSEDPWFLAYDDDWDISNDKKVSTSFAESAVRAYEDNYVSPEYVPFIS